MALSPTALADEIDHELRALGEPPRAISEQSYLKSELVHYGVRVPEIAQVAKGVHRRHADMARSVLARLVRSLWRRGVHECRMAAVDLLDLYGERLTIAELPMLERMVRQARTWALVDPLATDVVGPLAEGRPGAWAEIDRWAEDDDFWLRRAALLSQLRVLRAGGGDFARFSRYADTMLEEREFFIRKAIGWVLRETAKQRPDLIYEWLRPRAHVVSGVTWREAVKPLPADQVRRLEEMRARRRRA